MGFYLTRQSRRLFLFRSTLLYAHNYKSQHTESPSVCVLAGDKAFMKTDMWELRCWQDKQSAIGAEFLVLKALLQSSAFRVSFICAVLIIRNNVVSCPIPARPIVYVLASQL